MTPTADVLSRRWPSKNESWRRSTNSCSSATTSKPASKPATTSPPASAPRPSTPSRTPKPTTTSTPPGPESTPTGKPSPTTPTASTPSAKPSSNSPSGADWCLRTRTEEDATLLIERIGKTGQTTRPRAGGGSVRATGGEFRIRAHHFQRQGKERWPWTAPRGPAELLPERDLHTKQRRGPRLPSPTNQCRHLTVRLARRSSELHRDLHDFPEDRAAPVPVGPRRPFSLSFQRQPEVRRRSFGGPLHAERGGSSPRQVDPDEGDRGSPRVPQNRTQL